MKFFNLPKKIWVPTLVVCAVILAFVIIFPIVYCVALKVDLKINASQVEQTQQMNGILQSQLIKSLFQFIMAEI